MLMDLLRLVAAAALTAALVLVPLILRDVVRLRREERQNIQHPTPNIEHPMPEGCGEILPTGKEDVRRGPR